MINICHKISFFLLDSFQNSNDLFILVQGLIISTLLFKWRSEISHWSNDHFLVKIWKIFQFFNVLFEKLFRLIKLTLWIIYCSNVILYLDYLQRIRTEFFFSNFKSDVIIIKGLLEVLNVIICHTKLITLIGHNFTILSCLFLSNFYQSYGQRNELHKFSSSFV